MANEAPSDPRMVDPEAKLEQAFIEQFLRVRGYDLRTVQALPPQERNRLLREASIDAAAKLSEVDARAHYLDALRRHE
jgi:hypothetical protein